MLNSPILSGRFVEIKIGVSQGAIGWADPLADGTRPHNVSWSTGDTDYNISADLPAEQLANIARTLVCKPGSD